MKKSLSEQIRIAGLLCTFMVIMRHSRNLEAFYGTESVSGICAYVENGFSVLTEIAVPYFFLVSGFFFFRTNYYTNFAYRDMMIKKIRTLLVPFLIWNIVWGAFLYSVGFFDWQEPWSLKLTHLANSNYYGALWYVRTLMVFMLVVPIYGWIFVINNKYLYLITGLVLLAWWRPVDCSVFSTEGMLFFFIGGIIQRYNRVIDWSMPKWWLLFFCLLWISLCFIRPCWSISINKLTTFLGISVFWLMLKGLPCNCHKWLFAMCPVTFFIYVNHFWIVKGMKVTVASYWPQNELVALLSYFLLPVITFVILFWTGRQWKNLLPKLYNVCMGGR